MLICDVLLDRGGVTLFNWCCIVSPLLAQARKHIIFVIYLPPVVCGAAGRSAGKTHNPLRGISQKIANLNRILASLVSYPKSKRLLKFCRYFKNPAALSDCFYYALLNTFQVNVRFIRYCKQSTISQAQYRITSTAVISLHITAYLPQ